MLTDEVRQESLWTMMFADDIEHCRESRDQVEDSVYVSMKETGTTEVDGIKYQASTI